MTKTLTPVSYSWNILQMDCYSNLNGETNVVYKVHWMLDAADGTHAARIYGTADLEMNGYTALCGGFIPFEDLTFEQARQWVEATLGEELVGQMKLALAEQLTAQIDNFSITRLTPWGAQ